MRLNIRFIQRDLTVADVPELRWWRSPVRYTAALYGGCEWIRDDTNDRVGGEVAVDLEAARLTMLDIRRREAARRQPP